MSKVVDSLIEKVTENMLAGAVEAKYESLEGDIAEIVGGFKASVIMDIVKRYWPPEFEYTSQLADLKARE